MQINQVINKFKDQNTIPVNIYPADFFCLSTHLLDAMAGRKLSTFIIINYEENEKKTNK